MLITYLEVREELVLEKERLNKNIEVFPSISIIVPCFNEESTVNKTVRSILDFDYPQDKLSIILVDDGSTDGTKQQLVTFKDHPQVSILLKKNGGKYTAL